MKRILILLLFLCPQSAIFPRDSNYINEKFAIANSLYQKGEFSKAKEIYQELVNQGVRDKRLFFNLGNTFYRLNEFHRAILFYERARLLDPFDEDVNFNLQIANLRIVDKFEPIPKFFLSQWWEDLRDNFSSTQWSIASVICIWLSAFFFAMFLILKTANGKKFSFLIGVILLLAFLSTSILSYSRFRTENAHSFAIVFSANAYIKSSPEDQATDLFILHQGTKIQIIDQVGNWFKIRVPNGNIGWLKKNDIEII